MRTIKIKRLDQDSNQTIGICSVHDENGKLLFSATSMERGWRNNESNVSCVPTGSYPLKLEYSSRFKTKLWELKDVPNRSECKFHAANYWFQLNGCIALGQRLIDMNKDGYCDITNSKATMNEFQDAMDDEIEATLIIEGV